MTRVKINILYCCVLVLSVLMITSCSDDKEKAEISKAKAKAEREKYNAALKIGVMPTMDCLPIYLLKDSNMYDSTKVDIRLKVFTAQMDCDTALVGGSIQGSVTDLVRASRIKRKGTPLWLGIATNAYWQLITNKSARLKELSQLSDKMVAMTRYSVTDMLTDMAIKKGKPKYPVYKIQINDVFIRLQMLANNEMDAMWLTEPQATAARQMGHGQLMDTQKDSLYMGVIAFRIKDLADDRRYQQVEDFKAAYNKACEAINRNGVGYYADIIKKYMHANDSTIKALPKMKFPTVQNPRQKDVDIAERFIH